MKNTFTSLLLLTATAATAQVSIWTEDFGSGCNTGQLATAYTSTNGAWTMFSGANGTHANTWYVSATEAGMGEGQCGDGCGNSPNLSNRSLHVGSVSLIFQAIELAPADPGASYNAGGLSSFGFTCNTQRRIESPAINLTGYTDLTLSFLYMEGGETTADNGTVAYNDGTQWIQLEDLPKTLATCDPQGLWTKRILALPANLNIANAKIAFEWVNDDGGTGTDPSFAIDDIEIIGDLAIGIDQADQSGMSISGQDGDLVMNTNGLTGPATVTITDMTGRSIAQINTVLKGTDRTALGQLAAKGLVIVTVRTAHNAHTVRFINN